MQAISSVVGKVIPFIANEFKGKPDQYAAVFPEVRKDPEYSATISDELLRDNGLFRNDGYDALIERAQSLFSTDELRIRWIKAVLKLRQTRRGWVLDTIVPKGYPNMMKMCCNGGCCKVDSKH